MLFACCYSAIYTRTSYTKQWRINAEKKVDASMSNWMIFYRYTYIYPNVDLLSVRSQFAYYPQKSKKAKKQNKKKIEISTKNISYFQFSEMKYKSYREFEWNRIDTEDVASKWKRCFICFCCCCCCLCSRYESMYNFEFIVRAHHSAHALRTALDVSEPP